MRGRRPNPKLAKTHRNYSVDDAATLCGVHRNTVRQWIKNGLPCIDDQRPMLILGQHLADHIRAQRKKHKRPCAPGQIYCMRCREPRLPAGLRASYLPRTPTNGDLAGHCGVCATRMFRRVSLANLARSCGPVQVATADAQGHIAETTDPTVNSDFNRMHVAHDKTQPQE